MSSIPNQDKQESDFSPEEMHNILGAGHLMGQDHEDDFDLEVRQRLKENQQHQEANAGKMRSAAQGGENRGPTDLAPGQFENTQVTQQQALDQQAATQSAQQASQAQAAQMPVNAPRQVGGQQGISVPYKAQKRGQQPPGPTEGLKSPPASGK